MVAGPAKDGPDSINLRGFLQDKTSFLGTVLYPLLLLGLMLANVEAMAELVMAELVILLPPTIMFIIVMVVTTG